MQKRQLHFLIRNGICLSSPEQETKYFSWFFFLLHLHFILIMLIAPNREIFLSKRIVTNHRHWQDARCFIAHDLYMVYKRTKSISTFGAIHFFFAHMNFQVHLTVERHTSIHVIHFHAYNINISRARVKFLRKNIVAIFISSLFHIRFGCK